MPKTRTRVYRVATETPTGWQYACVWCHQESAERYPTWDAAVDALMDVHAPTCALYQRWLPYGLLALRRQERRRQRALVRQRKIG